MSPAAVVSPAWDWQCPPGDKYHANTLFSAAQTPQAPEHPLSLIKTVGLNLVKPLGSEWREPEGAGPAHKQHPGHGVAPGAMSPPSCGPDPLQPISIRDRPPPATRLPQGQLT